MIEVGDTVTNNRGVETKLTRVVKGRFGVLYEGNGPSMQLRGYLPYELPATNYTV